MKTKSLEILGKIMDCAKELQYQSPEQSEEIIKYIRLILYHEMNSDSTKFNIYDYVGDDPNRPTYQGVFHDEKNKVAVATDGHYITLCGELYNEEYGGKILKKDGTEIRGIFPPYHSITNHLNSTATYRVNPEEVKEWYKQAKVFCKEHKIGKEQRMYRSVIRFGELYYSALLFYRVLKFMEYKKCYEFHLTTGGFRAGYVKSPDGDMCVLTGVLVTDKDKIQIFECNEQI